MKVLIDDDDAARAARMARVLAARGYDVELSPSPSRQANELTIVGGGSDVLERCRAMSLEGRRLLVLLPTAEAQAVLAAIDAGADAYLTPPFSDARLVASVQRLCEPDENLARAREVFVNMPGDRLLQLFVCALEDGANKLDHSLDPVHHHQFMALVAHELRNPLQSLLLRAQLANTGEPRALAALPSMVDSKVTAVVAFISEMLDVADLDAGKVELEPQSLAVVDVVSKGIARAGDTREVALHVADDVPAQVEADPERFARIVENFVRNAFRYAPAGSAIEVSIERRNDMLRVSVDDHGPSIPAADSEQVFGSFYRRQGVLTGLGLHVNRRLAELHGGRAGVDGSTFWVEIPIGGGTSC